MPEETTDVAALFARLKEEIRGAGPRGPGVPAAQVRLSVRDQAERLWPVSAERPIVKAFRDWIVTEVAAIRP